MRGISIKDIAMQTVAERIKFVRGNLSREDFADAIGVHKNTVGRYERGESEPEIGVVAQICLKFEVDPQWLILGNGRDPIISTLKSIPYFKADGKSRGVLMLKRPINDLTTETNIDLLTEIINNLINDEALPLKGSLASALAALYYEEMQAKLISLAEDLNKLVASKS